jgi:hypothetical protein
MATWSPEILVTSFLQSRVRPYWTAPRSSVHSMTPSPFPRRSPTDLYKDFRNLWTDWLPSDAFSRLPEPSENKMWSWVPQDSKQRTTLLGKANSNLPFKEGQNRRCNEPSAYTEGLIPLLNTCTSVREETSWSQISTRPETKCDCAGEDQKQFNGPTDQRLLKVHPLDRDNWRLP